MAKSIKKLKEILFDIYRDLYKASEPSADFDYLVETAEIDKYGRKIIPYDKYFIDQTIMESIIQNHMVKNKLTKREKNAISFEIYLGCSPTQKREVNNGFN